MDISTLSVAELKLLLSAIPAEIARREADEKRRVRKELEELAAKSGYSLEELLGKTTVEKPIKAKKSVAIKYQHSANSSLKWTGRGRQPKWVVEFISSGGTLEQLAV